MVPALLSPWTTCSYSRFTPRFSSQSAELRTTDSLPRSGWMFWRSSPIIVNKSLSWLHPSDMMSNKCLGQSWRANPDYKSPAEVNTSSITGKVSTPRLLFPVLWKDRTDEMIAHVLMDVGSHGQRSSWTLVLMDITHINSVMTHQLVIVNLTSNTRNEHSSVQQWEMGVFLQGTSTPPQDKFLSFEPWETSVLKLWANCSISLMMSTLLICLSVQLVFWSTPRHPQEPNQCWAPSSGGPPDSLVHCSSDQHEDVLLKPPAHTRVCAHVCAPLIWDRLGQVWMSLSPFVTLDNSQLDSLPCPNSDLDKDQSGGPENPRAGAFRCEALRCYNDFINASRPETWPAQAGWKEALLHIIAHTDTHRYTHSSFPIHPGQEAPVKPAGGASPAGQWVYRQASMFPPLSSMSAQQNLSGGGDLGTKWSTIEQLCKLRWECTFIPPSLTSGNASSGGWGWRLPKPVFPALLCSKFFSPLSACLDSFWIFFQSCFLATLWVFCCLFLTLQFDSTANNDETGVYGGDLVFSPLEALLYDFKNHHFISPLSLFWFALANGLCWNVILQTRVTSWTPLMEQSIANQQHLANTSHICFAYQLLTRLSDSITVRHQMSSRRVADDQQRPDSREHPSNLRRSFTFIGAEDSLMLFEF